MLSKARRARVSDVAIKTARSVPIAPGAFSSVPPCRQLPWPFVGEVHAAGPHSDRTGRTGDVGGARAGDRGGAGATADVTGVHRGSGAAYSSCSASRTVGPGAEMQNCAGGRMGDSGDSVAPSGCRKHVACSHLFILSAHVRRKRRKEKLEKLATLVVRTNARDDERESCTHSCCCKSCCCRPESGDGFTPSWEVFPSLPASPAPACLPAAAARDCPARIPPS